MVIIIGRPLSFNPSFDSQKDLNISHASMINIYSPSTQARRRSGCKLQGVMAASADPDHFFQTT